MLFQATQSPNFQDYSFLLRRNASLNGLVSDVTRDANQTQIVVQNSTAHNGAKSNNTIHEDATLIQDGSAENLKKIELSPPPSSLSRLTPISFLQPFRPQPVSLANFAGPFLSRGRTNINQGQGASQKTFASLYDDTGTPSRSINNIVQNEDITINMSSNLGTEVSLQNPIPNHFLPTPTYLLPTKLSRLHPHQVAFYSARTPAPRSLSSFVNLGI